MKRILYAPAQLLERKNPLPHRFALMEIYMSDTPAPVNPFAQIVLVRFEKIMDSELLCLFREDGDQIVPILFNEIPQLSAKGSCGDHKVILALIGAFTGKKFVPAEYYRNEYVAYRREDMPQEKAFDIGAVKRTAA